MATSKQAILERVRRHQPSATPLPELAGDWIRYDDPREQFARAVESVGGVCHLVSHINDGREIVETSPEFQYADSVCSLVEGIGRCDVSGAELERPHDLAGVGLTIARGDLAVAENGAVWFSGPQAGRAIVFLCEHLVLLVPANALVHTMHEAYSRLLGEDSPFAQGRYGVFISGPSKTADIEQCLVIGAHGPRSLRVILIEQGMGELPE